MFTKEMMKALGADGEKLRQLTGEDHGPAFIADAPDFEALRTRRNAAVAEEMKQIAEEHGFDLSQCHTSFDPNACYCACAEGGPCEHDFQGWREFEDGHGGEQVCSRCGMGAMSHSLHIGM